MGAVMKDHKDLDQEQGGQRRESQHYPVRISVGKHEKHYGQQSQVGDKRGGNLPDDYFNVTGFVLD
jgi:hypothetical protein